MRTLNFKMILLCLFAMSLNAQQKVNKTKQTLEVNKDVTIDLNTNYVEIEVDTWNKNTVQVEAYLESSELSQEELEKVAKNWDLDVNGSMDRVSIRSNRVVTGYVHRDSDYAVYLQDLEMELAKMPKMPKMAKMPKMPDMPEMPELPELPEFPEGVHSIEFDVDAYKRDGEAYMEKWSKEYEEKYGKDFRREMEIWAKKFADSEYQEKMEAWGKEYAKRFEGEWAKDMEEWGEEFGEQFGEEWAEKMEAWGERFGEQFEREMEGWARRYEREMERTARDIERQAREIEREAQRAEGYQRREEVRAQAMEAREAARAAQREARTVRGYYAPKSDKVKKVIKIKIPKKAKLKVNVRHGELTFASVIHDLKADVAYAPFTATEIDGGSTSINISYAPVLVENWKQGELILKYVDEAILDSAERLILTSNSSNVELANLLGSAMIDGSFGDLDILNIADSFSNLTLFVENSQARIALPKAAYSLQYKGNRSKFSHPDQQGGNETSYNLGDLSSGKSIVLNAKFSQVSMQ